MRKSYIKPVFLNNTATAADVETNAKDYISNGAVKTSASSTGFANDATTYRMTAKLDTVGATNNISVVGSATQTIAQLLTEIQTDLDAAFGASAILITLNSAGTQLLFTVAAAGVHTFKLTDGTSQPLVASLYGSGATIGTSTPGVTSQHASANIDLGAVKALTDSSGLAAALSDYTMMATLDGVDHAISITGSLVPTLGDVITAMGVDVAASGITVALSVDGLHIVFTVTDVTAAHTLVLTDDGGGSPGIIASLFGGGATAGALTPGTASTVATQTISNTGVLGTFTGATASNLAAHADYAIDISVNGTNHQLQNINLGAASTWTQIATAIQAKLQTATGGTETVAIDGGKIKVTSTVQGSTSHIAIAAPTGGGTDLLAAITAIAGDYVTTIDAPVAGLAATAGTATLSNGEGTFAGATVPAIGTNVAYCLDVTIDGVQHKLIDISILAADDWDDVAAAIQTSIQTAFAPATPTCAISGGKILVTSTTAGTTSTVVLESGTGAGYADLIETINSLIGYTVVIDTPVDGDDATAGTGTVSNTGTLATFASATVPGLTLSALYALDITIDGGALTQLDDITISNVSDWGTIANAIQVSLQAALTPAVPTVVISGGKILVTSDTTGAASAVLIADGTSATPGAIPLLAAIDALAGNYIATVDAETAGTNGTYAVAKVASTLQVGATSKTSFLNDATTYTIMVEYDGGGGQSITVAGSTSQTVTNVLTTLNTALDGAFGAGTIVATLNAGGMSIDLTASDNLTIHTIAIADGVGEPFIASLFNAGGNTASIGSTLPGIVATNAIANINSARVVAAGSKTLLANDSTAYTMTATYDAVTTNISVVGSAAQTVTTLLNEINADLPGDMAATLSGDGTKIVFTATVTGVHTITLANGTGAHLLIAALFNAGGATATIATDTPGAEGKLEFQVTTAPSSGVTRDFVFDFTVLKTNGDEKVGLKGSYNTTTAKVTIEDNGSTTNLEVGDVVTILGSFIAP